MTFLVVAGIIVLQDTVSMGDEETIALAGVHSRLAVLRIGPLHLTDVDGTPRSSCLVILLSILVALLSF